MTSITALPGYPERRPATAKGHGSGHTFNAPPMWSHSPAVVCAILTTLCYCHHVPAPCSLLYAAVIMCLHRLPGHTTGLDNHVSLLLLLPPAVLVVLLTCHSTAQPGTISAAPTYS